MGKDTANNIKLGVMVTMALLLFVVAIYFIGSRRNMFGNNFYISSVFRNVNGLQPGNNVRYAGINVGTVDRIHIVSDSTVEVHMKLNEDVRKFIKEDAFATIGSDGLVGNMIVNISPGSGHLPPVDNQGQIASYSRTDTDDILNTLSSTNENIALLSRDLLTTTRHINQGQGVITALLKDPSMVQNLQQSLRNLDQVTASSLRTLRQLESMAADLKNHGGLLGFILEDTSVVVEVRSILDELSQSSHNLVAATNQLQEASQALSTEDGPMHTLLYDSIASKDLRESLSNIREGTELFNKNMEALQHNWLFRKYFRKKDKEKEKAREN